MAMLSQVSFFDDDKQGSQGAAGTAQVLGQKVFFKQSEVGETVCELEMAAGKILWLKNDVHFCAPKHLLEMEDGSMVCSFELLDSARPLGSFSPAVKEKSLQPYMCGLHQTFAAAAVAHSVGIAHADLHTGNVMMVPTDATHVVYDLGGKELMCVATGGYRAVVIDFGMCTVSSKDTLSADRFTHVGQTPNGRADFAGDVRTLMLGSCYDIIMMCVKGRKNGSELIKGYKTLAAYKNILEGVSVPDKDGWFCKQFPSADDAVKALLPACFKWHIRGTWYVLAANLCKTLVSRPYQETRYSKDSIKTMWTNLLLELGLMGLDDPIPRASKSLQTKSLETLKSIVRGRTLPTQPLMMAMIQVGEMAASVVASCYVEIERIKRENLGECVIRDALDAWIRLPVECAGPLPEIGQKVLTCTVNGVGSCSAIVDQQMLENLENTRSALADSQAAAENVWDDQLENFRRPSDEAFATTFLKHGTLGPVANRCRKMLLKL
ncbi:CTD-phosphotransferase [Largemouth bass virus]|nr:CTD-phosphotransferase [Largemouth bass virus]WHA35539.1 hypothetical protein MSRaV_51R [Micropterus salmoides ranavirus]WHA35644.1 hypothetical protein SCRaV_51R [Siniperca chuatsi ranavirus]